MLERRKPLDLLFPLKGNAKSRELGDETPKIGAHDKAVIFLHPKDFYGTLIELEQE